jgi:hypothetical protein
VHAEIAQAQLPFDTSSFVLVLGPASIAALIGILVWWVTKGRHHK